MDANHNSTAVTPSPPGNQDDELLTDDLRAFLADVPSRPGKSRMDPYRGEILLLRQRGYSCASIQRFLATKKNLAVSRTAVHNYVKTPPAPASNKGAPVKAQTRMPSALALASALALTLALTACGGGKGGHDAAVVPAPVITVGGGNGVNGSTDALAFGDAVAGIAILSL